MKLIRIFPRRTKATPMDENVVINRMPNLFDEADEIHISVAFTWDLPIAEKLYQSWRGIAPIFMGGPALNEKGGEFEPGLYLKNGYTITSRGCPNKCWFCSVWKREPELKELKIKPGYNILDDNLLACSDHHIKAVFKMLKLQNHRIEFTGGFEAKRFKEWHIDELLKIKLEQLFFAYDTPDDYEPLINVSKMLKSAGLKRNGSHDIRCYVLIGYPNDTIEKAEKRIKQTIKAGFFPFAMRYRDKDGVLLKERKWNLFQREWANPKIIAVNYKNLL